MSIILAVLLFLLQGAHAITGVDCAAANVDQISINATESCCSGLRHSGNTLTGACCEVWSQPLGAEAMEQQVNTSFLGSPLAAPKSWSDLPVVNYLHTARYSLLPRLYSFSGIERCLQLSRLNL